MGSVTREAHQDNLSRALGGDETLSLGEDGRRRQRVFGHEALVRLDGAGDAREQSWVERRHENVDIRQVRQATDVMVGMIF